MSRFNNRPKRDLPSVNSSSSGKDIFFTSAPGKGANFDTDRVLRQTYYITELQRMAISLMSAHEDIDKSEIVRNALEAYLPKKYLQMALFK